jgi:hypothetical protein
VAVSFDAMRTDSQPGNFAILHFFQPMHSNITAPRVSRLARKPPLAETLLYETVQ